MIWPALTRVCFKLWEELEKSNIDYVWEMPIIIWHSDFCFLFNLEADSALLSLWKTTARVKSTTFHETSNLSEMKRREKTVCASVHTDSERVVVKNTTAPRPPEEKSREVRGDTWGEH